MPYSMRLTTIHIPTPCAEHWDAMTPTTAGRHCAACQTEVVDFTRLTEAEVLAYLAARPGQRVCARTAAPAVVPQHPRRRLGRWLLAAAAFVAGPQLVTAALPPLPPPGEALLAPLPAGPGRITIRGQVLDDSLHVPIPGAYVFIKGSKYGAVTNEQGEFSFSFATDWPLASAGELLLEVSAGHFTFLAQVVTVHFAAGTATPPLLVRLRSRPGRGFIMGRAVLVKPPVAPPESAEK